jgi:hypothetical protein
VCYDVRNVPDAMNESPAIAKVVFTIVAVTVVVFTIHQLNFFDPWVDSLITACGFFISFASLMMFYFLPKVFLLLSGIIIHISTFMGFAYF